jgi:adenosylmethionine-8-amino-7-oxononanoate aminotransferase
LKEQARRLLYCSPNLHHEPMLQLAQRLTGLAGLERIAFSASASEANQENRLKLMMNSLTEKEPHGKTLPFIRNTISARKGKVL